MLKNVRLSNPWKYTNKVEVPSNESTASGSSGGVMFRALSDVKKPRAVAPPNFDDPEAEDFWSDDEPEPVHTGEP